jgi:hypothetical protein
LAIETFTGNGAFVVTVLKKLQTEIFEHLGISNVPKKVDDCLDYLLQVTTGHARDQLVGIFKQGRRQFASMFAISEHQRDAIVHDKGVFFEWLVLNGDEDDTPEDTLDMFRETDNEYCQQYESYVWFKMGKLMWVRH